MSKFSGIDLHSNNSVVVVSDETDQVVYERRHANDLAGILAALEPYRAELVGVVVESTYNWYWLVGLMEAGYAVHLANTTAIKKYEGLKYSGDEADAAYLAKLLRLGLLPYRRHCETRRPGRISQWTSLYSTLNARTPKSRSRSRASANIL